MSEPTRRERAGDYAGYQPRREAPPEAAGAAPQRRKQKRRITVGLAVAVAVAAFALGALAGWVGRGGPSSPALVTTNQEIPAVTVTQEGPAG